MNGVLVFVEDVAGVKQQLRKMEKLFMDNQVMNERKF